MFVFDLLIRCHVIQNTNLVANDISVLPGTVDASI
jgi:hypothetical protein